MATTVSGVWFIASRHMIGWPLSLIASALYLVVFAQARLFADAALQLMFVALCLIGWFQWFHHQREQDSFTVRSIGYKKFSCYLGLCLVVSILIGLSLRRWSHDAAPFADATLCVFSVMAQIWTAQRYRLCWIIWAIVDTVYVGLYISRGLWLTSVVYVGLTILALWAWRQWGEKECEPL